MNSTDPPSQKEDTCPTDTNNILAEFELSQAGPYLAGKMIQHPVAVTILHTSSGVQQSFMTEHFA